MSFKKAKKLDNLDSVEKAIRENHPDWEIRRGNNTFISPKYILPDTGDYEVLQVFLPSHPKAPCAEFWRFGDKDNPDSHTGYFAPRIWNFFAILGPMDSIMQELEDNCTNLPKIFWSIED